MAFNQRTPFLLLKGVTIRHLGESVLVKILDAPEEGVQAEQEMISARNISKGFFYQIGSTKLHFSALQTKFQSERCAMDHCQQQIKSLQLWTPIFMYFVLFVSKAGRSPMTKGFCSEAFIKDSVFFSVLITILNFPLAINLTKRDIRFIITLSPKIPRYYWDMTHARMVESMFGFVTHEPQVQVTLL